MGLQCPHVGRCEAVGEALNQKLNIGIIGSGIAGLAAASFLKLSGHNVTIHEKFASPSPIGAGLLLQPTGLAVLEKLGLAEKIINSGSRIDFLYGTSSNKRVIFDISYANLYENCFGLGIHRGVIFSELYNKSLALGVEIICSSNIIDIDYTKEKPSAIDANGKKYNYDLLVDAQGMKSCLRNKFGQVKLDKEYPYSAVWAVCKDSENIFSRDTLAQKYKQAKHMIGVLPIGKDPHGADKNVAFFWSLKVEDFEKWKNTPLNEWKDYVKNLWPATESLLAQFNQHTDLTFVTYRDVVMKKWHYNRLLFIGDSAHCTSPQLGQGANLALMDAYALSKVLAENKTIETALKNFTSQRKKHIKFYQAASRMLTPFFQSDRKILALIRDYTFGPMCKAPYIKTEMLRTLAGLKTGMFSYMKDSEL